MKDANGPVEALGPSKLVYKKYRGNLYDDLVDEMLKINSPLIQSLIFYELSKLAWGPKLYGLFENGRVEEFVNCHTLSHEEAFAPELIYDVAKAYARFHSLDLPVARDYNLLDRLITSVPGNKESLQKFLESHNIEEVETLNNAKRLMNFPFEEVKEFIDSVSGKVKQRTVFCTMDPNYLNRLVKNEKSNDPSASRVLIIDFDFSGYFHRGYDLAGHFINRMLDWTTDKPSGIPYPNETERMTFLSAYLKESEKRLDDFDNNSIDSLQNLTLEVDLNVFVYLLLLLAFGLRVATNVTEEPSAIAYTDPMLDLYSQLRKEFHLKYPNLVGN